MKKAVGALLIILSITSISYTQSGWVQKITGTIKTLQSICMIDSLRGFVAGYQGRILKTTNGGENWVTQSSGMSNNFFSVFFINKDTGFVGGELDGILKTSNGGNVWLTQNLNYVGITCIHFFNKSHGVCLAERLLPLANYYFLNTYDGGNTWNEIFHFNGPSLTETIYFVDSLNGYLGAYGGIFKTINGGNSWAFISLVSFEYNDLYNFLDINTGFMGSSGGRIKKTTNGGISWNMIYQYSSNEFPAGYFLNNNTGYASGYSMIIKTTNGGTSWITQFFNYESNGLYEMFFLNLMTGFAIGENGIILKTTNGGDPLGIEQIGNLVPQNYSLSQNYPNPFNPVTKISFGIPSNMNSEISNVKLTIFDVLGREVTTLVDQQLKPGTYDVDWDASVHPSGVYFYMLQTEQFTQTKKMVLVK